ncbi:MAG: hypothetical protein HC866_25955 [Leptolyngbyaceae cyanobacterium RU_5_1]|nr:hypothetical protein [Leptolyngbyaceae cyanobacterium RU_5_1]
MQAVDTHSPEHASEHLSPVAAKMILAALPEKIQKALLAHAAETGYPIEMVLEMAIAGFLDSECINFSDCKPEYS